MRSWKHDIDEVNIVIMFQNEKKSWISFQLKFQMSVKVATNYSEKYCLSMIKSCVLKPTYYFQVFRMFVADEKLISIQAENLNADLINKWKSGWLLSIFHPRNNSHPLDLFSPMFFRGPLPANPLSKQCILLIRCQAKEHSSNCQWSRTARERVHTDNKNGRVDFNGVRSWKIGYTIPWIVCRSLVWCAYYLGSRELWGEPPQFVCWVCQ